MTKRLYRSRQHRVFAGVCGGLGEYFDVDPVFVRILTVILAFAHGIGLIAYIVAWIAMPKAPLTVASSQQPESPSDTPVRDSAAAGTLSMAHLSSGTHFHFSRRGLSDGSSLLVVPLASHLACAFDNCRGRDDLEINYSQE